MVAITAAKLLIIFFLQNIFSLFFRPAVIFPVTLHHAQKNVILLHGLSLYADGTRTSANDG